MKKVILILAMTMSTSVSFASSLYCHVHFKSAEAQMDEQKRKDLLRFDKMRILGSSDGSAVKLQMLDSSRRVSGSITMAKITSSVFTNKRFTAEIVHSKQGPLEVEITLNNRTDGMTGKDKIYLRAISCQ